MFCRIYRRRAAVGVAGRDGQLPPGARLVHDFHYRRRQGRRVMPHEYPRRQQGTLHNAARRRAGVIVNFYRILPVGSVALQQTRRDRRIVHQQIIQRLPRPQILRKQHQKIRRPKAVAFSRLGHQIADMNLDRRRFGNGAGYIFHQQVRQHARINIARPQHDGISVGDGRQRRRMHIGRRIQIDVVNAHIQLVATQVYLRFPAQQRPVLQAGEQGRFGQRNGQDAAPYIQHPGGGGDGAGSAAGNLGHRRQQQIAEAVAVQPLPGGEPILKKPAHHIGRFGFAGQRQQAPPQVAGRQMPQLIPQTPAAAAAVGHRYDGRKVAVVRAQPGQRRIIAGAPTDHNYVLFPHQPIIQTAYAANFSAGSRATRPVWR